MTDLNAKIAARRAELARLEQEAKAEEQAAAARQKAEEARQRENAAADLTAEINAGDEARAVRDGERIQLMHEPDLEDYAPDMKPRALARLLNDEARRRWEVRDQWAVISLIAGGVCLIHLAGFGLLLILIGFIIRGVVNKRCRAELRHEYPELFGAVPEP